MSDEFHDASRPSAAPAAGMTHCNNLRCDINLWLRRVRRRMSEATYVRQLSPRRIRSAHRASVAASPSACSREFTAGRGPRTRNSSSGCKRLRDVAVHAGLQAALFETFVGVRRQRDDRRSPAERRFALANGGRGGQTVHVVHFDVHQDHVERARAPRPRAPRGRSWPS